ncbi:bifunctional folylpolyglutamate synthase/dihydrofolate synthase [Sulfurovum sp. XGS-02]|uniref:bifunctional folylpolyglutamate synthase/dihydrofolate synthase n=1 Tax=Sulfurovum sp. XGS-02 TaxID=2925411 RepID=UPI00206ACC48|nr:bifunctional folylpolyglutamate synthase/dihydrofolate synthase [Sulfurovum sp. XGS-02]UPT77238.1 bifunctional folylpolyglutamate synthase/dihydrofolate synthase [Sulfurovum sp. XGS-02]
MMDAFDRFLQNKPLYYKEIDHQRVHSAYGLLKPHIKQPRTVHIVGTNGKGSTGRMLAHLAYKSGLKVGHFSSPHILKFNERIWLNGSDSTDEALEAAHQRLFVILGKEMSESLSYFEYTTLLAFVVFEDCDLMVLEAGLGGEFDATNVCDKALSVITPIGIDHQAFLGESIEAIAGTKIRSIQKEVLLAPQVYDEVLEVAKEITEKKGATLHLSRCPSESVTQLRAIAEEKSWGEYLVENACVALQALELLHISYEIEDLRTLELFGRFYPLTKNIRIDVGHNPLAAKAIEKALDKKVVLIYNSLDDKDYEAVLRTLKPKVKQVEIIPIHSQRATTLSEIEEAIQKVGISYSYFEGKIDKNEHYLVFGSFYVVEEFLNRMQKKINVPK